MDSRVKRFVFFCLTILFFLIGTWVLIYANGWTIDAKTLSVSQTGAIFLKSFPSTADIRINNQPYSKQIKLNPFQKGDFINHLMPGDYEISVGGEGYRTWSKNMGIKAGLVSTATQILLLPEEISRETLAISVDSFVLFKDSLIFKSGGNLFYKSFFSDGAATKVPGNEIIDANPETKAVVSKKADEYFLSQPAKDHSLNIKSLFLSLKETQLNLPGVVPITGVLAHPFDSGKVFIQTQKSVYLLDVVKPELKMLFFAEPQIMRIQGSDLFFVDQKSNLHVYSFTLQKEEEFKIFSEPFAQIQKMQISPNGSYATFLDKTNSFYVFSRSSGKSEKITAEVAGSGFSPDGKKIAFYGGKGNLSIYFFEDYNRDFRRKTGEYLRLDAEFSNIEDVLWLAGDFNYLFVKDSGRLVLIEIDDRQPLNNVVLAQGVKTFTQLGNRIYILKNTGELIVLDLGVF